MHEVRTTCPYCGVGCGVLATTDGERITAVRGDPDHPANRGRLCTKGSTLHLTTTPYGRALSPELRDGRDRSVPRRRSSWDEVLDALVDRFATTIAAHGPDSVGFYLSGQLLTEDYYVFNKLAKGLIGTNNVDTNSRLCMSSAVAGYKATLGADAPPACYDDLDHAELVLIAGSNMAWAHPVLYRRLEDARAKNPLLRVVCIDPRRTETARAADMHLPILPGTDVALFNAVLHWLLWEDAVDGHYIARHTEGFAELKLLVRDCSPAWAARVCGVDESQIIAFAGLWKQSKATLSLYCQGLNQSASGTEKNAALINLHLATAQIGKPGAGPFSLTGQPNAMGGREVGGLANLLPGHREVVNAVHRAEVARLWGVDSLPSVPGKSAIELFDAVRRREIKLLWIACTNPAQSLPDLRAVASAFANADCVIVQEAFRTTESARLADVLLPATTWGEKHGTVTNSERRITHVNAVLPPPGEARHDWDIVVDFARRLERRLGRARPDRVTLFPYEGPEAIFMEHRETTRGRDLDITGLDYALLDASGPQQWPLREGDSTGAARLYVDGAFPTESGRARFRLTPYRAVVEPVDARYPFALTTGRLRDQWHGMSRTGRVPQLFGHEPEPMLSMNGADIARRGLVAGEVVRVNSRRGELLIRLAASDDVRSGQCYVPMHWGTLTLAAGGSHGINALTVPAFDPVSKQPELKHTAVRIERANLSWSLVAFAYVGPRDPVAIRDALREVMRSLGDGDAGDRASTTLAHSQQLFASTTLIGNERPGVVLRLSAQRAPERSRLEQIDRILGLAGSATLAYDDARRHLSRRVHVDDGRLVGVRLAGDLAAEAWMRDFFLSGASVIELRQRLLAGSAAAPLGFKPRGRVVCNCFNVTESEIAEFSATAQGDAATRLASLQAAKRCGSNCGSCLPELRTMVASAVVAA
ncbi:MAG: molybdopterin-dependent oxidoreductase [Burkholderiales bacterium]|nr:molybdopterin-dependent oxidoreductase [Burkholderiales bacterium]